jgi:acyl-CoA hydrolase
MDAIALYQSKLTTAEQAVATIPSGSRLSMGMFAAGPPALLKALADRAAAGAVGDLRAYYYESARIAGDTILRYELNDRILPYCMFVTGVERALIKRGMEDGGRKVVYYVPSNFHQAVRLLTKEDGRLRPRQAGREGGDPAGEQAGDCAVPDRDGGAGGREGPRRPYCGGSPPDAAGGEIRCVFG